MKSQCQIFKFSNHHIERLI